MGQTLAGLAGRRTPVTVAVGAEAVPVAAPKGEVRASPKVQPFSIADFARVPVNSAGQQALPASWLDLAHLNRYVDVLPNAHSRVRLQPVGSDPLSEYINANHIRGVQGLGRPYIAAQGPMRQTIADFWRMVWEQGSTAVVMLTGLTEGGRLKCEQYWPNEVGQDGEAIYGGLRVTVLQSEPLGPYVRRTIRIRLAEDDNDDGDSGGAASTSREVQHFWYTAWPDRDTPRDIGGILDMLRDVRRHSGGTAEEPWVVHCSAGIGRTGTFIAIDMGATQLSRGEEVDVLELIRTMRQDRGGMVQTAQQAEFVSQVLLRVAAELRERQDGGPWREL